MDRTQGFLNPERETRSWDEQLAGMEAELGKLLPHAYANAPAVRAKFDAVGAAPQDIRTVGDLARVPVTSKMELVELQKKDPPFGGLLAVPLKEIAHVFQSPGPIYDPIARGEGWGFEEAYYAAGFRPGDLVVNTFGYQVTPGGMMFDDSLLKAGCAVVPMGGGERETQVEILRRLPVAGYLGMASFLMQIAEKAREIGLDPRRDFSLEVAWSIAEPLPPSLRQAVEDTFGCLCRQGYGTADVGCIGFECFHLGGWHLTSRAIVEIVDPTDGRPLAPGEIGEVVVTLLSHAYPLIRFGTGDLSALDPGACACGRRSPKLRGWLGRADQLVKVKGQFVHPGQLQGALKDFPEVRRFRAVVTREGSRDVLAVRVDAQPDDALKARLEERLREVLRIGATVVWAAPAQLPEDGKILEDARTWE
ncbi:MAG: AMP-binding protein [Thermodesulfobacteriota bacterium]|jgi:phenylacetate-CoA ligase